MVSYGYYPPLYDVVTTGFYQVLGASATTGRLTAVMFSLFSIWVTFEFAKRIWSKIAVSAVMLGVMPVFLAVEIAMLETMLILLHSTLSFSSLG
jgi:4-amino-4-deoxy-L-arabinose transferase-like glycosyltransferase